MAARRKTAPQPDAPANAERVTINLGGQVIETDAETAAGYPARVRVDDREPADGSAQE